MIITLQCNVLLRNLGYRHSCACYFDMYLPWHRCRPSIYPHSTGISWWQCPPGTILQFHTFAALLWLICVRCLNVVVYLGPLGYEVGPPWIGLGLEHPSLSKDLGSFGARSAPCHEVVYLVCSCV